MSDPIQAVPMREVGRTALQPDEVAQLLQISGGVTYPGDVISTLAVRKLRAKGFVAAMEGWYAITEAGAKWLRCAELAPQRDGR